MNMGFVKCMQVFNLVIIVTITIVENINANGMYDVYI